jgi:hypothetical protein
MEHCSGQNSSSRIQYDPGMAVITNWANYPVSTSTSQHSSIPECRDVLRAPWASNTNLGRQLSASRRLIASFLSSRAGFPPVQVAKGAASSSLRSCVSIALVSINIPGNQFVLSASAPYSEQYVHTCTLPAVHRRALPIHLPPLIILRPRLGGSAIAAARLMFPKLGYKLQSTSCRHTRHTHAGARARSHVRSLSSDVAAI